MWSQAGFDPDRFWYQTPLHFQIAMRGVRKRLSAEAEARLRHAWWGGAFTGLTQSKGGLKPLDHYLRRSGEGQMQPKAMLSALQSMQARGVPMTIRRVRRRNAEVQDGQ